MFEWVENHPTLLVALGIFSVVTFVGSLLAIPLIVVRMPADYFLPRNKRHNTFHDRHQKTAWIFVLGKNLLGLLIVLAGIAMLVLPGQGILCIFLGISVMNFPGKRKLEIRILRLGPVIKSINWIRKKRGKKPLLLP